jgi:predicted hotdog family 3-hydroxylacyl-ACP dehydratase
MKLNRLWIEAHIPQQGAMCLLDEVLEWDAQQVLCRSGSHRRPEHPLRAHGRVGSVSLIEYAAQAAAVHGALLKSNERTPAIATGTLAARSGDFGVLASARSVDLLVSNLNEIAGDLLVQARCLNSDGHAALYAFCVSEADAGRADTPACLARGRLSLWLDEPASPTVREHTA